MILKLVLSIVLILLLLAGWILVQHLARLFAARHPDLGPAREEGGSCLLCLCGNNGDCPKKKKLTKRSPPQAPEYFNNQVAAAVPAATSKNDNVARNGV